MHTASAAPWGPRHLRHTNGRRPGRGWEIAGVILAFVFFWPAAFAYIGWKLLGYPVPTEWKAFFDRNFTRAFDAPRPVFRGGTGNLAFDEYRGSELARLEAERRRLDEEAQAFGAFVEELKRAKDREEFDAFMARRRAEGPTTA